MPHPNVPQQGAQVLALGMDRVHRPHGMPKRSPQEQRQLEKILGINAPQDESAPKPLALPPDLLHEINGIIAQNRELTAQIPAIVNNQAKMQQTVNAALEQIQKVLTVLVPQAKQVQDQTKIDTSEHSPAALPEVPNFKKKKGSHLQEKDSLPPSEQ